MSKIINSGLDQYGAEPFKQQQFGTAGVEGVKARCACREDTQQQQHVGLQDERMDNSCQLTVSRTVSKHRSRYGAHSPSNGAVYKRRGAAHVKSFIKHLM